ncbi:MAG: TetR/AcrR family transcriptional regulator [Pseudonocardia sp.]|nr:TetR/AcrR family transcriptional regulator [Pseudonocardia sp.]
MSVRTALHTDALLTAAFESFARYGFTRTTMADVASAAGMSRPALYLRVANKDELLRLVAAALLNASLERARTAEASDGPVDARVDGVLQAKLGMTLELAAHSAHAVELLDSYHRLAADESARFLATVEDLVAGALADTGAPRERCVDLATALTRAVTGLEQDPAAAHSARHLLGELVRATVAGLSRPLPS